MIVHTRGVLGNKQVPPLQAILPLFDDVTGISLEVAQSAKVFAQLPWVDLQVVVDDGDAFLDLADAGANTTRCPRMDRIRFSTRSIGTVIGLFLTLQPNLSPLHQ